MLQCTFLFAPCILRGVFIALFLGFAGNVFLSECTSVASYVEYLLAWRSPPETDAWQNPQTFVHSSSGTPSETRHNRHRHNKHMHIAIHYSHEKVHVLLYGLRLPVSAPRQ